jgi:hypothetical protein
VQQYLKWLQIESDWVQSDSWHPATRALLDVADLVLPGLGRLECRPVLPGEVAIALPIPSRTDAIGCLAVQLNEALDQGNLLGFAPASHLPESAGSLAIATLQSLDAFLDVLSELEAKAAQPRLALSVTHLNQWLHRTFEQSWLAIEEIWSEPRLTLAFRQAATVRRAKLVHLSGWDEPLGFVLSLLPETQAQIGIQVQVWALETATPLPPDLHLQILTETGELFREVRAGEADQFLQYEFTGQPGEKFSIALDLGQTRVVESFVI